jgi:hypothetical protein
MKPVSQQRLGKHVPAEMNTHITTEERCLRCGPCPGVILKTIRLTSSFIVQCTNDNGIILPTMTDKWQTRPLVREGAPHGRESNFQTRRNIWLGLDTKTDRLIDRQSQCDFDFDFDFWLVQGTNTSIVALRVEGSDKKGTQCLMV